MKRELAGCRLSMRGMLLLAPLALLVLLSGHSAQAEIIYVYSNIQAGINAAADGDTVIVHPGEYDGAGNSEINFGGKDILLMGSGGSGSVIINGLYAYRAFEFNSGETQAARVVGFTLRNFNVNCDDGGAIILQDSSPTFEDVVFEDCGSYCTSGPYAGGAIAALGDSSPILKECLFLRCFLYLGGAICIDDGTAKVESCRFVDCHAIHGGAFYVSRDGEAFFSDCIFEGCYTTLTNDPDGNYWGGSGGAGRVSSGASSTGFARMVDCTFRDCSSAWDWGTDTGGTGGALSGTHIALDRVLIEDCQGRKAGAIRCGSQSTIKRTTIVDCRSEVGAAVLSSGATVERCNITDNYTPGIYASGAGVSVSCSNLWNNGDANYAGAIEDQTGLNGNISANPIFCTVDYNPDFPFGLSDDSPCAAANNSCAADMGAFDVSCSATFFTISGVVRRMDGTPQAGVRLRTERSEDYTDANGYYEFNVPPGWSGTVIPYFRHHTLEPSQQEYTAVNEDHFDQDYTVIYLYRIKGQITTLDGSPLPDVVMTGGPEVVTTSSWGVYQIMVLEGWSGTITPEKPEWGFGPASRTYESMSDSLINEDYEGWMSLHWISGQVYAFDGAPLADVVMNGAYVPTSSDSSGHYQFQVPHGWSGTVTPEKPDWTFDPPFRSYDNLLDEMLDEFFEGFTTPALITLHRVPADLPDLQSAMDIATRGDTILVAPGTYSGERNRNLNWVYADMLMISEAGSDSTIIDLEQSGRFIRMFEAGDGGRLEGFTVRNGLIDSWSYGGGGGGIFVHLSSPVVRDVILEDCSVEGIVGGGAMYCSGSSIILENIVVRGNSAVGHNCHGGGLYLTGSYVIIRQATLHSNHADGDGGALLIGASDTPTILQNVTIAGNSCAEMGGGIFCNTGGRLEAESVILFGNIADIDGGGVQVASSSSPQPQFSCSDIYGNSPNDFGGNVDDPTGTAGNISADPLFCYPEIHDYTLQSDSPCLPWNNSCGIQIGAYGLGCGVTPVVLTEFTAVASTGAVDLTWRLGIDEPGVEFRLDAERGGVNWSVSWQMTAEGRFSARDESPNLNPGDTVRYELAASLSDDDWFVLDSRDVELPPAFVTALLPPHPNPFNPRVTIPFTLADPGRVKVDIYDLSGRHVEHLADGHFTAGGHELIWNGRNHASGVYLVRFSSPGYSADSKLVLLK